MAEVSDDLLRKINTLPEQQKRAALNELTSNELRRLKVMLDPKAAASQAIIDRLATEESPKTSQGKSLTPDFIATATTPAFDKIVGAREELLASGVPKGPIANVGALALLARRGGDRITDNIADALVGKSSKIAKGARASLAGSPVGRFFPLSEREAQDSEDRKLAAAREASATTMGPAGDTSSRMVSMGPFQIAQRVSQSSIDRTTKGADEFHAATMKGIKFAAKVHEQMVSGRGGHESATVGKIAKQVAGMQIGIWAQGAIDPVGQVADNPIDAAFNVLDAVGVGAVAKGVLTARRTATAMRNTRKALDVVASVEKATHGEQVVGAAKRVAEAATIPRGEVIARLASHENISPSQVRLFGRARASKADRHGTNALRKRLVEAERRKDTSVVIEALVLHGQPPGEVSAGAVTAALNQAAKNRQAAQVLRKVSDEAADGAIAVAKAVEDGVERARSTAASEAVKSVTKIPAKDRAAAARADATARRTETKGVLQQRSLAAAGEVNPVKAAEAGAKMQRGAIHEDLLNRIALSAFGATVSQVALADEDGLSYSGLFAAALGGWFMGSKGVFMAKSATGGRLSFTENIIKAPGIPALFPDKVISPEKLAKGLTKGAIALGAVTGGLATGGDPDREFSFGKALAGGLAAGVGVAGGFKLSSRRLPAINPRQMLDHYLVIRGTVPKRVRGGLEAADRVLEGRTSQMDGAFKVLTDKKNTEEELSLVMHALNDSLKITEVPERLRFATGTVRYLFDEMAKDLILFGAISGELAQKIQNKLGTYLPRLYIALEQNNNLLSIAKWSERIGENTDDVIRAARAMVEHSTDKKIEFTKALAAFNKLQKESGISMQRRGGKRFTADYLKKLDTEMPEGIRKALGEVNAANPNPGMFISQRQQHMAADIRNLQFSHYVASSPDNLVEIHDIERSIKAFEKNGEFATAKYIRPDGTEIDAKIIISEVKDGKGGNIRFVERDGEMFRQLPDSNRFGVLKGEYVSEEIANFFLDQASLEKGIWKSLFAGGMGLFKASKVPWNPGTIFRNFYGQVPLNDMGGVGPHRLDKYGAALFDYATRGQKAGNATTRAGVKLFDIKEGKVAGGYLEGQEAGLFGGEWFGPEVMDLFDNGKFAGSSIMETATGRMAHMATNFSEKTGQIAGKPLDWMRRVHEGTDQFSKLLLYRHARLDMKLGIKESVTHAQKWVFNYNDVPKIIDTVRRSPLGMPFISFAYKAMPRVMEQAINFANPRQAFRFWKYPLLFSSLNEYSHRELGEFKENETGIYDTAKRVVWNMFKFGTGGETEGATKYMPGHSRNMQLLLPYRDELGRMSSFDMTYQTAWGVAGDIGQGSTAELFKKVGFDAFPQIMQPSTPFVNMAAAILVGRDSFTQGKIFGESTGVGDNIFAAAEYAFKQFSPQLVQNVDDIFEARAENLLNDPMAKSQLNAGIKILGLSVKTFDKRNSIEHEIKALDREISEFQREINRSGRNVRADDSKLVAKKVKLLEMKKKRTELWQKFRDIPRTALLEDAKRQQKIQQGKRSRATSKTAREVFSSQQEK